MRFKGVALLLVSSLQQAQENAIAVSCSSWSKWGLLMTILNLLLKQVKRSKIGAPNPVRLFQRISIGRSLEPVHQTNPWTPEDRNLLANGKYFERVRISILGINCHPQTWNRFKYRYSTRVQFRTYLAINSSTWVGTKVQK